MIQHKVDPTQSCFFKIFYLLVCVSFFIIFIIFLQMVLFAFVVLVDHCTNNIYITFYYDYYDFKISVSWNAKASVKISFNTMETASID